MVAANFFISMYLYQPVIVSGMLGIHSNRPITKIAAS
jgi:hypothetical protein